MLLQGRRQYRIVGLGTWPAIAIVGTIATAFVSHSVILPWLTLGGAVLAAAAALFGRSSRVIRRPGHYGDVLVLVWACLTTALLPYSLYPPNSGRFVSHVALATGCYALVRICNGLPLFRRTVIGGTVLVGTLCAVDGTLSSLLRYTALCHSGLCTAMDLRSTFSLPITGTKNEGVAALIVVLGYILSARTRARHGERVVHTLAMMCVSLCIASALSLGALCGALVVFAGFVGRAAKTAPQRHIVIAGVGSACVLVTVFAVFAAKEPWIGTRFASVSRSLEGRRLQWVAAATSIQEHPLVGVGAYNYRLYHVGVEDRPAPARALNIALHAAAENGLPSAGVLIALYLYFVAYGARAPSAYSSLALGLIGLATRECSDATVLMNKGVQCLVWCTFGLLSPICPRARPSLVMWPFLVGYAGHVGCGLWLDARPRQLEKHLLRGREANEELIRQWPDSALAAQYNARLQVPGIKFNPRWITAGVAPPQEPTVVGLRSALSYYQVAMRRSPTDPGLQHDAAWLHWLLGNRAVARSHLAMAQDKNPRDAVFACSRVLLELDDGNMSAAETELARAVSIAPHIVESPFSRELQRRAPGLVNRAIEDAIARLVRWLEDGSLSPVGRARLGALYAARGQQRLAETHLTTAVSTHSTMSMAWARLSAVTSDLEQRRERLERALALTPSHPLPYLLLARVIETDEPLRSLTLLERAAFLRTRGAHEEELAQLYRGEPWWVSRPYLLDGLPGYINTSRTHLDACREYRARSSQLDAAPLSHVAQHCADLEALWNTV